MVKLLGPLHSTAASGKLGNAIQFAKSAHRNFAGLRRRPKQPQTEPQRAARIYMSFLSKYWSKLTAAEAASWVNAYPNEKLPAYNAFIKYNIDRLKHLPGKRWVIWQRHACPSTSYPATEDTKTTFAWIHDVIPGSLSFTHKTNIPWTIDNWLYLYHRSVPQNPWPTYNNLIGIFVVDKIGLHEHRIEKIPPGLQRICILAVSHTGRSHWDAPYFDVEILP